MSRARSAAALAVLLCAALALAQTTTTTLGPVKQTTEVKGDVPADVVGRWLVVGLVKLPDGRVRPAPRTWEIRQAAGGMELVVSLHPLPADVNAEVNAAAEAGQPWTPDADDLRRVDASWNDAPTTGSADVQGIETRITTGAEYPPEYKADAVTKDSKLAILIQENFTGRTAALRSISIYGVRELAPAVLKGSFVNTTLAAAPIPIPITLGGDFTAYRIGALSGQSWLSRLFSGCRR
jgi:hypothetical protein